MHNRKWHGDKLWYLLNLPSDQLKIIFKESQWGSIKSKRKLYRRKVRTGEIMAPRRPREYEPTDTPEMVRDRLQVAKAVGETAVSQIIGAEQREKLHKLLDETIDQVNINPGYVKGIQIRTGSHTGFIKTPEGEIEYTDPMEANRVSFILEPRSFEPKWTEITQVESLDLPAYKPEKMPKTSRKAVILPDTQIGYRRFGDGTTDPFHDEGAIQVALQLIKDVKPDEVIILGDFLDLPAYGRFEQTEDYAHTTMLAVTYGHQMLAAIRKMNPKCKIVVLEGNHDRRIEKSNRANIAANFSLKQAGESDNFPVLSVPHLVNFKQLGVEYVQAYPAGKYWINERLQVIHGHAVRSGGSTAALLAQTENVSTIFGHVHRIEAHYNTQNVFKGGRTNGAFSPGCLCRIDGAVPSAKGSTNLDGRPVVSYENWQQGLAVVTYEQGDSVFDYHPIYINTFDNHRMVYNGKVYRYEA